MCLNGSPNAYDVDNHVETALDPSSILGVSSYIFRCVAQSGLGLLVWGSKRRGDLRLSLFLRCRTMKCVN